MAASSARALDAAGFVVQQRLARRLHDDLPGQPLLVSKCRRISVTPSTICSPAGTLSNSAAASTSIWRMDCFSEASFASFFWCSF